MTRPSPWKYCAQRANLHHRVKGRRRSYETRIFRSKFHLLVAIGRLGPRPSRTTLTPAVQPPRERAKFACPSRGTSSSPSLDARGPAPVDPYAEGAHRERGGSELRAGGPRACRPGPAPPGSSCRPARNRRDRDGIRSARAIEDTTPRDCVPHVVEPATGPLGHGPAPRRGAPRADRLR